MMNLEIARPMQVQTIPIPLGDGGTAATIEHIRRLIEQGKKSPVVRETAIGIVQQARIAQHDSFGEARAVYYWVLHSIRFTRDIRNKETLHSADEILRLRAGDCDDFVILMSSLLGSIGHKLRAVTVSNVGPDPETGTPGEFTHIYPEDFVSGRWIPLDAARRNPAMGRSPRRYTRKRTWDLERDDFEDVAFLNGYGQPFPTGGSRQRSFNRGAGRTLHAWGAPMRLDRTAPFPGRGAVPGMGFDFGAVTGLIQSGAGAATQIIAATKGAATSAPGLQTGVAPGSYAYPFGFSTPGVNPSGGTIFGLSPTMLLVLLGGAAVLFAARR